jgi:CRP/FNR family transcriptional regulator
MSRIASSLPSHQDVATYLPRKPIQEFARKHTIYDPGQPCNSLYLVRSGRVVISNSFDGGSPVVTRIVGPNGIFGENLLIGLQEQSETAVVLDQARVMSWGRAEIEQLVNRDPRLGMALLAYFVKRCAELNERLEALAFRKTPERVMLGLLQLAETLGTPANGGMRLAPLTHQAIAEYVGTSREIVTSHMSELRRAGMLQYSRKFIEVNVGAMRETLRQQGIEVHPAETPMARAAF